MKNTDVREAFRALPDDQQICEMIVRLPDPFQLMAWIMVETGLRFSTIAELPVESFSATKKQLMVEQGTRMQRIELSAGLTTAVAAYLSRQRPVFEQKSRRLSLRMRFQPVERKARFIESRLFPVWAAPGYDGPCRDAALPSAWFVDALDEAARATGFDGGMHSHTLRHACAKRWFDQGLPLAEVNQRLGHRDVMTTLLLAQALRHGGLTFTQAA